ncbi:MAG: hypothetical protein DMG00_00800, partial [Acidobacteria bacterium]
EHLGRHVLGHVAVAHAPYNECVNALEVPLVQIREARRVALGRLDEHAIVSVWLGHRSAVYINRRRRKKLRTPGRGSKRKRSNSAGKRRGGLLHYSLLRTIEAAWHMPALGKSSTAMTLGEFFR